MFISTVAIKRPVFTAMLILAMITFGLVSLSRLGVDLMPKVDFPVISIITKLPGADPETIEKQVTDPLEESVNTLAAIKNLRSTSAEGYSLITIEFQLEKKIDVAFQEVSARVNSVRSQLPRDIDDPVVEKLDFDAAPILNLVLSGDLSTRDLYRVADKEVKERLQRVPDVGSVKLVGGRDRKLWLWLDPARMKQNNLTVQEVRAALLSQHVEMPGGRVENGRSEIVTRVKAEFQSAEELDNLVLRQTPGGTLRLRDVGRTEDGLEELRSYTQQDDRPCIGLQIRRQSGTNTVQVARDIKAEVARIAAELAPCGIRLDLATDLSLYIQRSVNEVFRHLMIGGLLAIGTVLIFLLNFRSTFISAMVLPTSIMATFIMLSAMGFTLNIMTLMALTLAIGLLIDDAIVVQENIMRHVQAGKPASFAAEFATNEIGLAVLATTLSVVAVFLPAAFTRGIIGQFFFPFGLTISFAVMISMLVSFTLDPMLSARLLRKQTHHNVVFRTMEGMFQATERVYEVILGWCLRHRLIVVVLAVALFAGSLGMARGVRVEFQPQEDQGEFNIMLKAPLGASLDKTRELMEQVRARVRVEPEVAFTVFYIGADELGKVNEGTVYVKLLAKSERKDKHLRSQTEMMEAMRKKIADVPEARTSVQMVNSMSGAGMKSAQIQYELCGPDLNVLDNLAKAHVLRLRKDAGYMDLDTTYETGRPESSITVNRNMAANLGVSPLDIADTIRTAIGGVEVAKFRSGSDRYDIAIRFLETGRDESGKILDLIVPSTKGPPVELRNVAHVLPSSVPVEINRYNRQREIMLLANLGRSSPDQAPKPLGQAKAEIEQMTREIGLPPGYSAAWTGTAQIMAESFANLAFTMMLSVIVIYMVLSAQFESLVHPFTIMLSLPLAFVGALVALVLFGKPVNVFTMMAFVFLLGLVTKNAILLIDYANTLRDRDGLPRDLAMNRAGPVRLRPILMTSVAMIFGMLPTALGTGEGSESRQPMAIAIIGGLVSSTLLTLLVVPVAYSLLDPLSEWFRRHVLRTRDEVAPAAPSEEITR